jgi:hypothetical protein
MKGYDFTFLKYALPFYFRRPLRERWLLMSPVGIFLLGLTGLMGFQGHFGGGFTIPHSWFMTSHPLLVISIIAMYLGLPGYAVDSRHHNL